MHTGSRQCEAVARMVESRAVMPAGYQAHSRNGEKAAGGELRGHLMVGVLALAVVACGEPNVFSDFHVNAYA